MWPYMDAFLFSVVAWCSNCFHYLVDFLKTWTNMLMWNVLLALLHLGDNYMQFRHHLKEANLFDCDV